MTLLQAQRGAIYLASGAALSTLFTSGEIPTVITALACVAFVLSFFVGEWTAGKATLAWNVAIIAVMFYLAINVFTGQIDLILAASLVSMTLLLHRLFNRGTLRDYAILHLTILMTISGGAALSADFAFAVAFLVFAVAGTWSLTLTLLRGEIEEEAKSNRVADGGRSLLNSSRFTSPRFLLSIGGLSLPAIGLAVAVFVLFPRVSISMWRRQSAGAGRTGFAAQVDLGGTGLIKDDPRVAFRVYSNRRYGTELGLYWRGKTLDTYDGRDWRDSRRQPAPLIGQGQSYVLGRDSGIHPAEDLFTVELVPDPDNEILFTTGRPLQLDILSRSGIMMSEPPHVWRDGEGDLSYRPVQSTDFSYQLRAIVEDQGKRLRGLGRAYPSQLNPYLELPKNLDSRIVALGKRLGEGKDPAEAVAAVELYLSNYNYSLNMTADDRDPLASFLFDVKSGHCEYFATALAVLLRVAGIPTRVVTGFFGGRYISNGGYYALREGDAHSWVEVYFPGNGWATFDATPAFGREARINNVYSAFELWMDGMRTQWRRLVVEYDLSAQIRGLRSVVEVVSDARQRMSSGAVSPHLKYQGVLVTIVLVPIVALIVWQILARRRKRSHRALPRTEAQRRAKYLYAELLRKLARQGVVRRPSQTPNELAAEVQTRQMPQAPTVSRVVARYVETYYGQTPLDLAEWESLRQEIRKV